MDRTVRHPWPTILVHTRLPLRRYRWRGTASQVDTFIPNDNRECVHELIEEGQARSPPVKKEPACPPLQVPFAAERMRIGVKLTRPTLPPDQASDIHHYWTATGPFNVQYREHDCPWKRMYSHSLALAVLTSHDFARKRKDDP